MSGSASVGWAGEDAAGVFSKFPVWWEQPEGLGSALAGECGALLVTRAIS